MKITILCVGKIKESFYTSAVKEYAKRLSKFVKLSIIEVLDEKTPEGASPVLIRQIKQKEGERLKKYISGDASVFLLAVDGKQMDSIAFADKLHSGMLAGKSHMIFLIGGSLGLADGLIELADCSISFSQMTFPHQLMRVILLEQIYRAYKIIHGEPYHK